MSEDRTSGQSGRSWLDKLLGAHSGDSEGPSSREELMEFLGRIYYRPVSREDLVTVVHFSPVSE